jgi:RNA polymerase sigma-70 factor (ECF subfamily)
MTHLTGIDHLLSQPGSDEPRLAGALLETYGQTIFQLCLSILGDRDEAKDATQETLLAALGHRQQYHPGTNLRAWLCTIAVNHCRGQLRKRQAQQTLLRAWQGVQSLIGHPPSPEAALVQQETQAQLWAAVNRLDEKHRLPVVLHYVHDFPTAEVAKILGLSLGTVHSRLHYAYQQLQGALARQGSTPAEMSQALTPGPHEVSL